MYFMNIYSIFIFNIAVRAYYNMMTRITTDLNTIRSWAEQYQATPQKIDDSTATGDVSSIPFFR